MTTLIRLSLAAATASLGIGAIAHASVFVPTGLAPGSQYYLAFVTNGGPLPQPPTGTRPDGTIDATSSNIAIYDAFAQSQAALNPSLTGTDMGVTWQALGSTSTVTAKSHLNLQAFPIYLLFGSTKVADDAADFWSGDIDTPIQRDQFGNLVTGTFRMLSVWTGSDEFGAALNPLGGAMVGEGNAGESDSDWAVVTNPPSGGGLPSPKANSTFRRIYAVSDVQRVPAAAAPEASSLAVWGLLALGVALACRLRTT